MILIVALSRHTKCSYPSHMVEKQLPHTKSPSLMWMGNNKPFMHNCTMYILNIFLFYKLKIK